MTLTQYKHPTWVGLPQYFLLFLQVEHGVDTLVLLSETVTLILIHYARTEKVVSNGTALKGLNQVNWQASRET